MSSLRSLLDAMEGQYDEVDFDGNDNEDDDPDYEDAEEDDDDDEFHDAEEGEMEFIVQLEEEDDDNEDEDEDEDAENNENGEDDDIQAAQADMQRRIITVLANNGHRLRFGSQSAVANFLRNANIGYFDDGEDEELRTRIRRERDARRQRLRNLTSDPNRFPKVPSEKGRELMESGTFGTKDISSRILKKKGLARQILDRELGIGEKTYRKVLQGEIAQSLIPRTEADMVIHYADNVYSGQFSDDGNFFYSCVKDFRVRMYDTSNPYNWRHYKTVAFPFGSWTLTDASLSPDNKWLAYTSIQSNVCLAPTDPNDTGDPYTLSLSEHGARTSRWHGSFGIWSIRFSGDGRELVAGTNVSSIVVYDIESRRVLHHIEGHEDDVNAVCFADKSSPHILYSGSDDKTIKVWDRRSMGDKREAGAFVGHIEGLTYIDSKDDGRYLLSNGKDQSMKLWDLKMMYTSAEFRERNSRQHLPLSDFDYRWNKYSDDAWFPHPDDNSVVTFRGHKVQRTLIRCHFSPPNSTNSRYVYSGSYDGKVWVYNLDATVAGVIDVQKTTRARKSMPKRYHQHFDRRGLPAWDTIVRDASWHPNAPFIAASALNGWDHAIGTVTLHGYNEADEDEGFPEMGAAYDEKLNVISGMSDDSDDAGDDDWNPDFMGAMDVFEDDDD
ncbi:WD40-repeat-containing domain protein [Xylariaceae sp. FL0255]|nr:WD40-repeat-containing domain protein [Xylariaceae sp. FL0255]